jgi:hypothetical protein
VLAGDLYAVGGNVDGASGVHDGVEAFDVRAGRWRACAPLAVGRTGLCALAV